MFFLRTHNEEVITQIHIYLFLFTVQKANETRALTLINLVNEAERRVDDLSSLVTDGTPGASISNTQQKVCV